MNEVYQCIDDDADRRDTVLAFYSSNMADDRRRTGASMPYSHHHQAVNGLNFTP